MKQTEKETMELLIENQQETIKAQDEMIKLYKAYHVEDKKLLIELTNNLIERSLKSEITRLSILFFCISSLLLTITFCPVGHEILRFVLILFCLVAAFSYTFARNLPEIKEGVGKQCH